MFFNLELACLAACSESRSLVSVMAAGNHKIEWKYTAGVRRGDSHYCTGIKLPLSYVLCVSGSIFPGCVFSFQPGAADAGVGSNPASTPFSRVSGFL